MVSGSHDNTAWATEKGGTLTVKLPRVTGTVEVVALKSESVWMPSDASVLTTADVRVPAFAIVRVTVYLEPRDE